MNTLPESPVSPRGETDPASKNPVSADLCSEVALAPMVRVPATVIRPGGPDHAARKHHKYGMSKLNAYRACAGYLPNDTTNAAAEDGTRQHEIMDVITVRVKENPGALMVPELDALRAEGNTPMDDNDYAYLRFCCEKADFWLRKGGRAVVLHNEINVQVLNPDGTELNHGHLDLLIILPDGKNAVLFDWKFGWIPVPEAEGNLQGMGYALGCFHKFAGLERIGVLFVQPKLGAQTVCPYSRENMHGMYRRIREVIDGSLRYAATQDIGALRPNPYCDYCQRAGSCPALVNAAQRALAVLPGDGAMALPPGFTLATVRTPEDIARALYIVDRLETLIEASKRDENGIKGVRKMALDLAKANGGTYSVEIAPGKCVVLEARQRKMPRSIEHPAVVAKALEGVLTPAEVLDCCDLSITKLENAFADKYTKAQDAKADDHLETARRTAARLTPTHVKDFLAQAKAEAKEMRSTKKAAMAIMGNVLSAEGLITAAEGSVDYLKLRLETKALPPAQP